MATRTFGRRGAPPRATTATFQPAQATAAPAAAFAPPAEPTTFDLIVGDNQLLADLPCLTVGLIVLLFLIFWIETRFAFDMGKAATIGTRSLIAFGAVSRDLVVGAGEWWRIGLAPLLHASTSHVVGNCIALFFVGARLEPMIGRGWFLLIFVASALGGVTGSLYGNLPGVPSVGASGAITGLIGALFVMSFIPYAESHQQGAMRMTALRFGVPALLPLAFGASGHVDYFAHGGGAIAGGALSVVVCAVWSDGHRPNFARLAGIAALAGLAGSLVCAGAAARHYAAYAANARDYIRPAEMPATMGAGAERSADLVARYPKDPRAHLMRAYDLAQKQQFATAEAELRAAMRLASADAAGGAVRDQAQIILAVVIAAQGRHREAKELAADTCRLATRGPMQQLLQKAKLCD